MRNGLIVVVVYAALLSAGAAIGHLSKDREARERIVDLEMENAALKSANRMLLYSVSKSRAPIYVRNLDKRNQQGERK